MIGNEESNGGERVSERVEWKEAERDELIDALMDMNSGRVLCLDGITVL